MSSWANSQIIKKSIIVTLDKSNNFQVNLNSLGLGEWKKGNIDYFVTINNINLTRFCSGYDMTLTDIGVSDPIYKLEVNKTIGDLVTYSTTFKTNHPYPQTHKVKLKPNTYMYKIYIDGEPSKGDSIWVFATANGKDLFRRKVHDYRAIGYYIGFKDIDEEVIIEGGWYEKQKIESFYEFSITEYEMRTEPDISSSFTVLFIEKEVRDE